MKVVLDLLNRPVLIALALVLALVVWARSPSGFASSSRYDALTSYLVTSGWQEPPTSVEATAIREDPFSRGGRPQGKRSAPDRSLVLNSAAGRPTRNAAAELPGSATFSRD